jgi:hypothetical protein
MVVVRGIGSLLVFNMNKNEDKRQPRSHSPTE